MGEKNDKKTKITKKNCQVKGQKDEQYKMNRFLRQVKYH